jgi:hypothetical protein
VAGAILTYPLDYRGYALNSIRDADGVLQSDLSQAGNYCRVDRFDFSRLALRDQRDAAHLKTGGDLGVGHFAFRYISLVGKISGYDDADLEDRISLLLQAFNLENALAEGVGNPDGTYRLGFTTPVRDPEGYGPLVDEFFLCRPAGFPVVYERRSTGLAQMWAVELVCADPRRYIYDSTSRLFNAANTWTRTLPNWGSVTGEGPGTMVYPIMQLVLTGAGHASLTMTPTVGDPFVMDLDGIGAGAHTIDIDMASRRSTSTASPRTTSARATWTRGSRSPGAAWTSRSRTGRT